MLLQQQQQRKISSQTHLLEYNSGPSRADECIFDARPTRFSGWHARCAAATLFVTHSIAILLTFLVVVVVAVVVFVVVIAYQFPKELLRNDADGTVLGQIQIWIVPVT